LRYCGGFAVLLRKNRERKKKKREIPEGEREGEE